MANRTRELSAGLWRLRIDSECGLVVNVYVLRDGGDVALIDTGFPHTTAQIEEGLAELQLALSDVTDVLYTHTHIDHMGGGVALDADPRWSPRQWIWEGTAPAHEDWYAHVEAIRSPPSWPVGFAVGPQRAEERAVRAMVSKPYTPLRVAGDGVLRGAEGVAFGEEVRVGGLRLVCEDGRGHDPRHCAWRVAGRGWFFSGDVVLAVPTPLVARMGDCPVTWLRTLARWEGRTDLSWFLPGHGMPTRLIGPSIARSRASFARVYEAVTDRAATGSAFDAFDVLQTLLPGDASRYAARSSGVLATIHTLLLLGASAGWVLPSGGPGALRWTEADGFPDLEAFVRAGPTSIG